MLDLDRVALDDLAAALQDHSAEHSWWLDPRTGQLELWSDWTDEPDGEPPGDRGWLCVEPVDSREAYGDMEDFVAQVGDRRARDVLARAIAGRGAFRRFKDALLDFPELRSAWFALLDARMGRRALAWLADHELIDSGEAERRAAALVDPEMAGRAGADGEAVARVVAGDLADLYGPRLRRVVLFGSWARGEADPESDVDVLVVLDEVRSSWQEGARMDDVLWTRSLEFGVVISAIPVAEAQARAPDRPLLVRAMADGLPVG